MILVVETLQNSLEQEVVCTSENRVHIGAIIPYLYFHNLSSGQFKFELLSGDNVLYEHLFSYSDIKGLVSGNYLHTYFPIVPTSPIQLEQGNYKLRISVVSDYSVKSTSFLGWVKQHEDIQLPMQYNPNNDNENTLTVRFKIYKDGL